jgi:DNA-binding CsgD family transcriptional regulator
MRSTATANVGPNRSIKNQPAKARADERAALDDRIDAAAVHGHQDQTRRKRDQCVPGEPILARIMQRVVLTAPVEADLEVFRTLLGRWLDAEDATVRQEREPRGRPGDMHWHLARSGKCGGTLEVTFVRCDPSRIEVDVHANRRGAWSGPAQQRLVAFLERELAPRSRPFSRPEPPDPCNSPPEPHGTCSDAEAIAFVVEQGPAPPVAASSPCAANWPASILTRREMEIARLIATGLTSRQIAGRLFLSERTVTTHVTNTLNTLGWRCLNRSAQTTSSSTLDDFLIAARP